MPEVEAREFKTGERLKVKMLGALYSAYKKAGGYARPLGSDAESLHPAKGDFDYNESYYFNFIEGSGIGGYTRIGFLPNQEADTGVMMLFAGGSRLLATHQGGRVSAGDEGLSIGLIEYGRLIPLSRWRLSFKGRMIDLPDSRMLPGVDPDKLDYEDVEVDLTFEGLAPPFNFKNADPAAVAEMLVSARTRFSDMRKVSRVSTEHYEQAGRCSGAIKIGDREIPFAGSGHRDHSWGVRDWSAPRLWTWLTCQFGDELAFNLSRVAIDSVDIFNGFLVRGGRNYPVRRAELSTEFEENGRTQKKMRFTMEDSGGFTIDVTGDVRTVIPLDLRSRGHSTLVNEALAEYRWGEKVAYGIAEYLHQAG
ncbi:MAG: hypothetical protein MUP40_06250 [Actinobacteria bacterium]|nr:hypothetical protein [Actinomycetota bacterium]